MQQKNEVESETQAPEGVATVLEAVLRQDAHRLLQNAIEQEVAACIEAHQTVRDERNHRLVVRHGRLPGRALQTGLGPLQIAQPRVHGQRQLFFTTGDN